MVVSVILGVYMIFFESPRKATPINNAGARELELLNTFITKVAEKTKTGPSKEQAYVLNKAQSAWKQDPLLQIEAIKKWWKENGASLILGLGIGVAALLGWREYLSYQTNHSAEASDLYQAVQTQVMNNRLDDAHIGKADLIRTEYSDTPYAALASMAQAFCSFTKSGLISSSSISEKSVTSWDRRIKISSSNSMLAGGISRYPCSNWYTLFPASVFWPTAGLKVAALQHDLLALRSVYRPYRKGSPVQNHDPAWHLLSIHNSAVCASVEW